VSTDLRRLALRTLMPGFDGTSAPGWVLAALGEGLGSVALYGPNITDADQLRGLCAELRAAAPRVVLAVDEEGGDVTRLHYGTGSPQPGSAVLGRIDDPAVTRAAAASIGAELAALGIDLDLAPVVDINSSPDNPVIGTRSFGADAALVARHSAAYVAGLQSTGVAACAKHFPGHGDTTGDSHHMLPVVEAAADVLRARELVPFRAAVEAGAACVMTAAVVVPALDPGVPATFSRTLLHDVLRGELGFTGVVVSDALDMAGASQDTGIPEAAVRALVAGCDLLCLGFATAPALLEEIVEAILAAVSQGRLDSERLEDAAASVDRLADRWAARPLGAGPGTEGFDPAAIVAAYRLSDRARAWIDDPRPVAWLQVGTAANLAVGHVPWGAAALGLARDEAGLDPATRVLVVGRGIGAGHPALATVERLAAAGHETLLVECGWPRAGTAADVVTWGGSPAAVRPLVDLMAGRVRSDPAAPR
jgi:beta-N-acetylhexosaminidase